jgi:alpha-2-macroglobulin
MRNRYVMLRLLGAVALVLAVGAMLYKLAPAVSARPALKVAQAPATQSNPPPLLVESSPADGAIWLGGPVVFTFDQTMAPAAASALSVQPALAGSVAAQDNTLTFTPAVALEPGQRYHFTIDERATSASGLPLSAAVEISLIAAAPLQVTSTQPGDGTAEVSTASQIVVVFNRPVVPLTGVDEQADLPQPLTIDPPVQGEGAWLNTSIFAFRPYAVTVDNVTGLSGETLAEPLTFGFTTAAPLVVDSQPQGDLAPLESPVVVIFSQPMDAASTEAAFSLEKTHSDQPTPVEGTFVWDETQTTLTFSPTQWLEFGASYRVRVDASAQPASRQGKLREAYTRDFAIVPLPAVTVVTPVNGATNVSPDMNVTIRFSAPLSYTTVLPNISVTPTLTTTQVYSYYTEYTNEASLSWFKEPNTTYTVTVGAAVEDKYGNQLGEEYSFHFTTGDYPPFTRINLDRFTHFSAYTETRVSVYYRNVESVQAELFRVPLPEFFKLTGQNQWEVWNNYQMPDRDANRIWSRSYAPRGGPNITAEQIISLTTEAGDLLPPGLYLLEVQQPVVPQLEGQEPPTTGPTQALIVLSNYNLVLKKSQQGDSLAWLTDLRSGEPVADQTVRFYLEQDQVGAVTTDATGIGTAALGLTQDNAYWPVRAIAGEPGEADFAAVSSEWSTGIAVWDFGLNGGYSPEQYQLHFYTDRPIYRPGQTVHWKGIVRVLDDDQYVLPDEGMAVHIVVRDDRGNAVAETEYSLNANSTVNGQLELASTALTGYYYLEARLQVGERTVYGGDSFQVASYRKPEFQIAVTPEQPEYRQGETVRVKLQASYFSGGGLGNAPVTWRLIAEPYFFNWTQGPQDRYFSFTPYDPEQENPDPYASAFYGLLQEGTGTTAADGSFVIEVPADIQTSLQSQRWAFDVTVQSPTNQFVSGRATVPIHKAAFYIGLSPQQYVVPVNDESAVDLVTVTPQGDPYPGADLDVIVYAYDWNSVYARGADGSFHWETSVNRTPVVTTTATTARQGTATITWTPSRGGQYQVVAQGEDDESNVISSATYVYVSDGGSGDFVAWPRENNDRIKLVADKQSYAPGDTAKILVPSPFSGPVQALFTLERAGVIESKLITLTGNSETIEVPIAADYIPNIFVSLILVKGVDESNPFPAMRVGYVQLNVDTSQKQLAIDVSPSAEQVKPGATVTYTLTVNDSAGDPVANAEVSVALVDKAVLSLATDDTRTLLDIFYFQRPLGVTSGVLLSINQDRLSQQLSKGAKGGGGGGGGGLEIREDFPDIAYWRADLTTDADGQIVFSVPLPDNLTTWTLAAKAITPDTLVGEAMHDVVASKELQVRPLLPRFFTAGDRAQISAVVLNTTQRELADLQFTITASGATIETDETELLATVDAGGQVQFAFPITVDAQAATAIFTMTANAQPLADAVRIELPILRYQTPEVVGTAGDVPPEGVVEAIRVPSEATDDGELQVTLEPSLAAGMIEGLNYLEHYPYECNEQTVSRFLPNLFTVRAVRALDIENDALENQLAYQLGIAVQRLISRQNADGGWGYWPGEESNTFITAYVVWGLASADQMDFRVPERTLANAVSYLERQFQAPQDVEQNWVLNELAFINFVLSEIGQGDPGRASTLYDARERLDYYGQALLAMTLANLAETSGGEDPRIDTLLDSLFGAAQLSATGASWHEVDTDYWTLNTDIRTTSIVLAAFARLDPEQPLLPEVVRWLMHARQAGRWSTTQENAWAIIALTDWLAASGELDGDYEWTALLNGAELGRGVVTPATVADRFELRTAVADLVRDQSNLLQINRSNGSGQLYYTTHLRYYLDALAIDARDRGIVVDRRFERDGQRVDTAKVGDVISVTVTIVAPTDLYQVLIETPIPAGTEPIDVSLATTSNEFGGPELQPTMDGNTEGKIGWQFWTPTYTDLRDDRVALFATHLRAGTYEFTFQVRASVPGEYRVLPVYAEMMYFNEVWGRSAGSLFTVQD